MLRWRSAAGQRRSSLLRPSCRQQNAHRGKCREFASAASVPAPTQEPPLFGKVLIANRGEIACRVMETCQRLGIKTVAVYSEADAEAKHTRMADEAVCIGPAPSSESYLDMEAVLDAVKATGANAVHPGYGFLSENAAFSKAVEAAGAVFLGPDAHAINQMGDKIMSMRVAQEAGVSTAKRYDGVIESEEQALELAEDIGYPIILKASAGGGGKGMRVVWEPSELPEGLRMATAEAESSFGDTRMLLQQFVCPTDGRHIEIQVLADSHGNVVYLNERECSLQRRNQKVIEEAPSVLLDEETRQMMGEQACSLARAVGYRSAGTVEFIVDNDQNFYFLEMNTRLQVEHPVTELITGVDLVEQMLRVGAGLPLSIKQEDINISGWAVEARVYAENPFKNFLPSVGRVQRYAQPRSSATALWQRDRVLEPEDGIRCDSGIVEGSNIDIFYDPMISKLIAHAPSRAEACAKLATALDSYVIRGVDHNVPFLRACLSHPRFLSGEINTDFIKDEFPQGFEGLTLDPQSQHDLAACVAAIHCWKEMLAHGDPENVEGMTLMVSLEGGSSIEVTVAATDLEHSNLADGLAVVVAVDGLPARICSMSADSDVLQRCTLLPFDGIVDELSDVPAGQEHVVQIHESPFAGTGGGEWQVQYMGAYVSFKVRSPRVAELETHMPARIEVDTSKFILSPMPGAIVSINVAEGDHVVEGQEVAVIEAMKMQNVLRAERGGVVKSVKHQAGAVVDGDELIIEFED